jgi:tRNA(Ile)-lysidine synthase
MILGPLRLVESAASVSVDRAALAALHPAVRARILRALVRKLGSRLDETSTKLAAEFAGSTGSGFALDVGGGITLLRDLDRVTIGALGQLEREQSDRPLVIPDAGPGSGEAWLGGRPLCVSWGGPDVRGALGVESFDPGALRFPLRVRSREAGDRIRLPSGSKKVKKLMLEARIPRSERGGVPLVVDAHGDVLWIPGVARAEVGEAGPRALTIGVG